MDAFRQALDAALCGKTSQVEPICPADRARLQRVRDIVTALRVNVDRATEAEQRASDIRIELSAHEDRRNEAMLGEAGVRAI